MGNRSLRRDGLRWTMAVAITVAGIFLGLELTERDISEDASAKEDPPSLVEPIAGTGRSRVTLSQRAVERLGLRTDPVRRRESAAGALRVVPYSALLYDERGRTWVYVRVRPRSFARAPVVVDSIDRAEALLSAGPGTGREVVSVGAAELYGAELGVDH